MIRSADVIEKLKADVSSDDFIARDFSADGAAGALLYVPMAKKSRKSKKPRRDKPSQTAIWCLRLTGRRNFTKSRFGTTRTVPLRSRPPKP